MIYRTLRSLTQITQQQSKCFNRTICGVYNTLYSPDSTENSKNIIVRSPFPDLEYPDVNIDQFIWKDFNKWNRKVAIVSRIKLLGNFHKRRDGQNHINVWNWEE